MRDNHNNCGHHRNYCHVLAITYNIAHLTKL